jgi:proline iminopeptidase
MKIKEGFVPSRYGRIGYRVAGDLASGAVPLLLVHGGPGCPSDYLEPFLALAGERPVVLYDQLGCGRSDKPAGHGNLWVTEYFVGELGKVRQALKLEVVHLYGHSWGSQIAVDYALTRPEGVMSYVLADPPLCIPRFLADLARYRQDLPEEVRGALDRHEAAGTTDSEEYRAATRAFYERHFCRRLPWPEPVQRAMAGSNDDVYLAMWGPSEFHMTGVLKDYDRSARLHEIDGPVLFLCGRYDEATPETTAWYQSLVPGAELAVIEDASHTPHVEQPEATLAAVRSFLHRAEAGRAL